MNNSENSSILIVEDETIVAWDIQETLENFGYDVMARVTSGAEAMELAGKRKPSLALMDIKLAGDLNGIETADRLYHDFDIPVVYLSAYSDDKTLDQVTQTNPFGYLLKPFHPKELHTTIQVALQRHQRESQTQATQQWFANTLNSLGEPTIATDRAGKVTYMNHPAQELTGWNPDQAIGLSIDQVLPLISQKTREEIVHPNRQAMASQNRVSFLKGHLLQRQNGLEIEVQSSATPMLNEAGNMVGSVIVFQEIEQPRITSPKAVQPKRSSQNLAQLLLLGKLAPQKTQYARAIACTKLLLQLLNQSSSPQATRDCLQLTLQQLVKTLKLDYAWIALHDQKQNRVTVRHESRYDQIKSDRSTPRPSALNLEFSRSDFPDFYCPLSLGDSWNSPSHNLLPTPYQSFVRDCDRVLICPLISVTSQDDLPPLLGEIGILTTDDSPWTALEIRAITAILRHAFNLSQRSELDSLIRAQQIDLDVLNYLKEDFISSVSHELITPLSNMKMSMEMIHTLIGTLSQSAPSLPISQQAQERSIQKLEEYLRILQEEWERECNLVNDLLNFQSPASLFPTSEFSDINLLQWLPTICDRFLPQTNKLKQILIYQIDPEDLTVYSHLPSLERIVTELLNNACKYTPADQMITISARTQGDRLKLTFTNTGIQIPEQELEEIFKPFYRLVRPNPWDYCGMGLGLALVKKSVLRLGGTVQAESSPGLTRFVVTL